MTAAAAVPSVITMTDTGGRQHYVSETAVACGHQSGRYIAMCDREITPASLTTPDGDACRSCALWAGRWSE